MNSKEIAGALARSPASEELHRLYQACDDRRAELRARVDKIGDAITPPAERTRAVLSGPDALLRLDKEVESLEHELTHLAAVQSEVVKAQEKALDIEARTDIPVARKRLPAAMERARAALRDLDAAIAELDTLGNTLGQYERLPNWKFGQLPLSDDELADLIQLRDLVWKRRDVRVLQPPDGDDYKRSWALFYETRGGKFEGQQILVRRPGIFLPDVVTDDGALRSSRS